MSGRFTTLAISAWSLFLGSSMLLTAAESDQAPVPARMVKKLDLLESNHGCGPNGLSWESIPKRK